MKIPKKIRVGPHRYRVVTIDHGILEGAGSDGSCAPRHLVIALDGGQPASQMADTLLHELAHAMLATVGFGDDGDEMEERIALALGPALLALIRDNPKLVDWVRSL